MAPRFSPEDCWVSADDVPSEKSPRLAYGRRELGRIDRPRGRGFRTEHQRARDRRERLRGDPDVGAATANGSLPDGGRRRGRGGGGQRAECSAAGTGPQPRDQGPQDAEEVCHRAVGPRALGPHHGRPAVRPDSCKRWRRRGCRCRYAGGSRATGAPTGRVLAAYRGREAARSQPTVGSSHPSQPRYQISDDRGATGEGTSDAEPWASLDRSSCRDGGPGSRLAGRSASKFGSSARIQPPSWTGLGHLVGTRDSPSCRRAPEGEPFVRLFPGRLLGFFGSSLWLGARRRGGPCGADERHRVVGRGCRRGSFAVGYQKPGAGSPASRLFRRKPPAKRASGGSASDKRAAGGRDRDSCPVPRED